MDPSLRGMQGSNDSCAFCAQLNAFLENPARKEAMFDAECWSHFPYSTTGTVRSCYPNNKLVKNNEPWRSQHSQWISRFREIQLVVLSFDAVKDLFGDDWEEMRRIVCSMMLMDR